MKLQTTSMMEKFSIIDTEKILYEYKDDFEIFEELYDDYLEQYSDLFKVLKDAVKSKDTENVRYHAHAIKGIASNFYSEKLKSTAFELEMMGKNSETSKFDEGLKILEEYNERTIEEVRRFIDSVNSGNF